MQHPAIGSHLPATLVVRWASPPGSDGSRGIVLELTAAFGRAGERRRMKPSRLSTGVRSSVGMAALCMPSASTAASVTVSPGQSIQAASDAASAGDTVKVMPGDYSETHTNSAAIRITKPLKLLAKSKLPTVKVRILPGPGQS